MKTIKAHWNSELLTNNSKYCASDISNINLMSNLDDSEYVKFNYKLIPQHIVNHYNLDDIVESSFVYTKIDKAWLELKQSHKIAHDNFVYHLKKHSFTLVVDNFGIQNTDNVNYLISVTNISIQRNI